MKRFIAIVFALLLFCFPLQACSAPAVGAVSDGDYTIEVSLDGGTGRASISSPTSINITGGAPTATVEWSSPYFEFMLVDGIRYDPVQTQGNSTFLIPVLLDEDMPITAQTIAMSQPYEIDYILHFDSATLKPLEGEE